MPETPATAPLDPTTFLRDHVAPRSRRRVEELRAELARLDRELEDRLGAEGTVALTIEGVGGGTWYLNLREGETTVANEPAGEPVVRVYQSREDWEALARAQLAAQAGGPPGAGDMTRTRIERLRGLGGTIEFRLATDDGERIVCVQFGPGDRSQPRCTLRLRADDARRLQNNELLPQAAFLQGLVKIDGDLAFAMQVAAALMA